MMRINASEFFVRVLYFFFFFRSAHVQLVGVYAGALDGVTFVTKRNSAALKKNECKKLYICIEKRA